MSSRTVVAFPWVYMVHWTTSVLRLRGRFVRYKQRGVDVLHDGYRATRGVSHSWTSPTRYVLPQIPWMNLDFGDSKTTDMSFSSYYSITTELLSSMLHRAPTFSSFFFIFLLPAAKCTRTIIVFRRAGHRIHDRAYQMDSYLARKTEFHAG